jgi:2-phospho-L-lactate guanylyltransferase
MGSDAAAPDVGVVLPIRSFSDANTRLTPALAPAARAVLARTMAERVLGTTGSYPVVIVTSAPEVRAWAKSLDDSGRVVVLDDPAAGLDGAADAGRDSLRSLGCGRIVVVHADLPLARSLAPVIEDLTPTSVALVPCHREDGTNVISVPADSDFRFAYGPGSFRRHVTETRRLGLVLQVTRPRDLVIDVDVPEDLSYVDPALLPVSPAAPGPPDSGS